MGHMYKVRRGFFTFSTGTFFCVLLTAYFTCVIFPYKIYNLALSPTLSYSTAQYHIWKKYCAFRLAN